MAKHSGEISDQVELVNDQFNITHPSNLFLSIVSGTIGVIGIPGNIFLLFLIANEHQKRKPHEWLLFMLAFGDLILCMNNAFLVAPFVIHFSHPLCKVAGIIEYIFGMMSFITTPTVAYNRYLSLYNNTRYVKIFTERRVFIGWIIILLFCTMWMTPFVITDSLGQDDLGICGTQMKNIFLKTVFSGAEISVFTSYIFLAYFSYKVITKIRNHKKATALRSKLINESEEIITTMLIISAIPLFAQVPAAVVKGLDIFLPPFNPWVGRLAIAPFPLTSASNAYVTVYVVKDYRKKVMRMMKKTVAPTTIDEVRASRCIVSIAQRDNQSAPIDATVGTKIQTTVQMGNQTVTYKDLDEVWNE